MIKTKISEAGIKFIKEFEGLWLDTYSDCVGVLTIGYGHTKGVYRGQHITEEQATELLRQDIAEVERCLNNININLTQHQFDALCSFGFNVGTGAFNTNYNVGKALREKDFDLLCNSMLSWCHGNNNEVIPGLLNRRKAEVKLFKTGQENCKAENSKTNIKECYFVSVKKFKNGNSIEKIWTSNEHVNQVGTLSKGEQCDCLGIHNGHAIVKYVGSNNYDKVGFTSCHVQEQNGIIVPID